MNRPLCSCFLNAGDEVDVVIDLRVQRVADQAYIDLLAEAPESLAGYQGVWAPCDDATSYVVGALLAALVIKVIETHGVDAADALQDHMNDRLAGVAKRLSQ